MAAQKRRSQMPRHQADVTRLRDVGDVPDDLKRCEDSSCRGVIKGDEIGLLSDMRPACQNRHE
jgi:hypothetical protein